MRRMKPRLFLLLFVSMLVFLPVSTVLAVEIPPSDLPTFIQTNGPDAPIARGDWYTSPDNGANGGAGIAGYHYFEIIIPCEWPADLDIHVDLFSPSMNQAANTRDELNGVPPEPALATTFELYPLGTDLGGNPEQPDEPPPGPNAVDFAANGPEAWERLATLPAPVPCGDYVVRSQTRGSNENAWRLRVGNVPGDPNNIPLPTYDNPDGLEGTNDEITIGLAQTTYQHAVVDPGPDQCLTLYQYVSAGSTPIEVTFHNFDLDNNIRTTYYRPGDPNWDPEGNNGFGVAGTVSGLTEWNNPTSPLPIRGDGDQVGLIDPLYSIDPDTGEVWAGWWRIVTCVIGDPQNQYIQEGLFGEPSFIEPQPEPRMNVSKDDGLVQVEISQILTYAIDFSNISTTAPDIQRAGAALNVTLTDTLPPNTDFIGCEFPTDVPAGYTVYTGTCAETAPGVVEYALDTSVHAGAIGRVNLIVQVADNANDPIFNNEVLNVVELRYEDSMGNQFPPVTDDDLDLLVQNVPDPEMTVIKDDGELLVQTGQELTYDIVFNNITDTLPNPATAYNVTLTDTLPANTTYLDRAGDCVIVAPFTGTCNVAAGVATITINEQVDPGVSGTAQLTVRVNDDATDPQFNLEVVNVVDLNYTDAVGNPMPTVSDDDIDILEDENQPPGTPSMTLDKDDGVVNVDVGQILTYTITFTNDSDQNPPTDTATNVILTDTLPDNTDYIACSFLPPFSGNCAEANGTVIYALDQDVAPGETGQVQLRVSVSDDALDPQYNEQVYNVVVLEYNDSQGNPQPRLIADDLDLLDQTTPRGNPAMELAKDDGRVRVDIGDELTYAIDFANISDQAPPPGDAANITLTDTLPENTNYVSCAITAPLTGTCAEAAGVVTYTIDQTLAPGEAGQVTLTVVVSDNAKEPQFNLEVYNTVNLDYTDANGVPQPALTADDLDLLEENGEEVIEGELTLSKRADPPFANPGDTVTWTITVSNATQAPVTDVTVTDVIPGEMVITGVSSSSGSVSFSGQNVTFTQDAINPGEIVTITITTQVREDAAVPFDVRNLATLTSPDHPPLTATARVLSVSRQPSTGESPLSAVRTGLIVGVAGLMVLSGGYVLLRRRHAG